MKIGCSTWSFHQAFDAREMDHFSFAELAARLGLDGIELLTGTFPSVTPRYLTDLRAKLASLPVEISALAVSNDFAHPDADERRRQCEDLGAWTRISRDLGVGILRTFTGDVHDGTDADEAKRRVYECYERVLPTAERTNVTLAVENHGGVMNDAGELVRLILHFGSSALQLNPDPTNFLPGHARMTEAEREPIYDALARVARFAVHSHLKLGTFDADGTPTNVDVPRLLAIYRRASYNGYLSIETFGDDPAGTVTRGVAYLRPLLES